MIKLIEKYICSKRGLNPSQLHEKTTKGKLYRNTEYVTARQLIIYYAMENGYSQYRAGEYFGLDHSTAYHCKDKIRDFCDIYRQFERDIREYDKILLGLTKLDDGEIIARLNFDRDEKLKYLNDTLTMLESRLDNIKTIIFELKSDIL